MKKKNICNTFLIILVMMSEVKLHSAEDGFMRVEREHFMLNGSPFYGNGFNAYWLMYVASDPSQRHKISSAFQEAANHSLIIARTWAFRDGGYSPLQSSPGSYNEKMFQGLDYVISEAGKQGIKLILSLVDNFNHTGGKQQYVSWARDEGQTISSEDDFFTNPLVKGYYKNHIKAVLTRKNSISGIVYKDEPTIMAWELMNEPRCPTDPSGNTIQAWIEEMASYLKSIDSKHLLEVGLEGFYGHNHHKENPHFEVGTDFLRNNQIPDIDFTTVHSYPDQWCISSTVLGHAWYKGMMKHRLTSQSEEEQLLFLDGWLSSHIKDAETKIQKPLLFAEFGESSKDRGYRTSSRDVVMGAVYAAIYSSARRGGAAAGGLFWQLLGEGMDNLGDGYGIVLSRSPSTARLIQEQSEKLNQVRMLYKNHIFANG